MKTRATFFLMLGVCLSACTMPRNRETDKLGWTDPNPQRGPAFTDHHPVPGRPALLPGQNPATQPGPDTNTGEMKSIKSNPNDFETPPAR
jgi:hypothetical protein